MYPFLRLATELLRYRKAPPLGLFDIHETRLTCWPHDIDLWRDMNNGRTLTIYDLGRVVLFQRIGVIDIMRRHGWAGTVAGTSIRYRKRILMWDRFDLRTRLAGWDDRFVYVEQGIWRGETCHSHALIRTAVVGRDGMVPTDDLARAFGVTESRALPDWAVAWTRAEAQRPWPPEMR